MCRSKDVIAEPQHTRLEYTILVCNEVFVLCMVYPFSVLFLATVVCAPYRRVQQHTVEHSRAQYFGRRAFRSTALLFTSNKQPGEPGEASRDVERNGDNQMGREDPRFPLSHALGVTPDSLSLGPQHHRRII